MNVPKNLVWEKSGLPLNWQGHLEHHYFQTDQYKRAGIRIIDLTPQEILAVVQECWQRLQGAWIDSEVDLDRQQCFWRITKAWPDFPKVYGWIHPEARIGTSWLRSQNEDFFS